MMMDVKAIEEILINELGIILGKEAGLIAADAQLHSLGVDSMGFVELLVSIEKRFKLKLMETGLKKEDFRTVRSLAACIHKEISR